MKTIQMFMAGVCTACALMPLAVAARTCSQSIAYVGNRMWGKFITFNEQRCTPVFKPHSVTLDSIDRVPCGSGGHVFHHTF